MKKKLIQQGDVLFFSESRLPDSLKPVTPENGLLIFAKGEATGHHHSVLADSGVALFETDQHELWASSESPFTVVHQEHKPVTLPVGTYRIGIVREIDPFAEEVKSVMD